MPDINNLIARWWKQILGTTIIALIVVGIITFLKPREYLSVATAVPASAYANDKAKLFNDNIQELYSALGEPQDLDKVIGTAQLDTVYLSVTGSYQLQDHYKVKEQGEAAKIKIAHLLKQHTKVMKSEYGELKVKVWDTDKDIAYHLANAIMYTLQRMHSDLQNAGNIATLAGLKKAQQELKDKLFNDTAIVRIPDQLLLKDQYDQYEKLIQQYQLVIDSKAPVLIVVEPARAAEWPDRPKRMQTMIATAVLSLIFSFFAALLLDNRKP